MLIGQTRSDKKYRLTDRQWATEWDRGVMGDIQRNLDVSVAIYFAAIHRAYIYSAPRNLYEHLALGGGRYFQHNVIQRWYRKYMANSSADTSSGYGSRLLMREAVRWPNSPFHAHLSPGTVLHAPPQGGDDRIISRNERTTELISSFDDNRQTMYIDGGNPAATHTIKTHTLTRTETQTKSHTHTRSHTQSHNLHKHIIPTHIYTGCPRFYTVG